MASISANEARRLVEDLVTAAMLFERSQHEEDGDTQGADNLLNATMRAVLVHLGVKP